MNQPQSDEPVTVEKILRLVEQLSAAELQELRRELSKTWGDRFRQLVQEVSKDNVGTESIAEEEVADEVTKYRREKRAQGA
ncbi:hypothetical protein KF707_22780 [Candidatus Obscuribacterales bacterium]|nr:hypothetical protein [Candidatus Obscuribacterales bacterium]MBX3149110.1 hypothetical protein [Candidatus Obscuribacterales bacterium]